MKKINSVTQQVASKKIVHLGLYKALKYPERNNELTINNIANTLVLIDNVIVVDFKRKAS